MYLIKKKAKLFVNSKKMTTFALAFEKQAVWRDSSAG